MNEFVSYAQNFEDYFLSMFFENNYQGFYVDIGANDPDTDSVTKHFYQSGWRGINVEPISMHYDRLCKQRPEDINLNIGIGIAEGNRVLRVYDGDGLSTVSDDMKSEHSNSKSKATENFIDQPIVVKTLASVLQDFKVNKIEFLKVDVEGLEYEVLASNDWDKFKPAVICIESNHMHKDWSPLLVKHNYKKIFWDGLNDYWAIESSPEHIRFLHKIIESVNVHPIRFTMYRYLQSLKDDIISLNENNAALSRDLLRAQEKCLRLELSIDELSGIRGSLRIAIKGIDSRLKSKFGVKQNFVYKINSQSMPDLKNASIEQTIEAIRFYDQSRFSDDNLLDECKRRLRKLVLSIYIYISRSFFGIGLWLFRIVK